MLFLRKNESTKAFHWIGRNLLHFVSWQSQVLSQVDLDLTGRSLSLYRVEYALSPLSLRLDLMITSIKQDRT